MRSGACGIVTSSFPRTCSSLAKLTRRYIIMIKEQVEMGVAVRMAVLDILARTNRRND